MKGRPHHVELIHFILVLLKKDRSLEKHSPLLSQAVDDLLESFIISNACSDMFLRGRGTQAAMYECPAKRNGDG